MIRLAIKGSKKSATRAAARYNLAVKSCTTSSRPDVDEVFCDVPCQKLSAVVAWFGEKSRLGKRGYPPGTLLYYGPNCGSMIDPGTPRPRHKSR